MKSLIRFYQSVWKRSPGALLLAFTTGAFLFCSTAAADDVRHELSPALSSGRCSPTATTLCLNDSRFSVSVSWEVPDQGRSGQGTAVPLSGDTGLFWFFDASNIELVVKALDGIGVNGNYWVFYAGLSEVQYTITVTDMETGRVKTYDNQSGSFASVADTSAFASVPGATTTPAGAQEKALEAQSSRELYALYESLTQTSRVEPKTADPCAPGGATLCLAGSRFQLTVDWEIPSQGRSGHGTGVPISTDTGYFWFFDDANVELAVKVLDGRPINGHFWIFAAALSNVKYTLTVTDTQIGQTRAWDNPDGHLASWADTEEFSGSTPLPQDLSGTWTGTIALLRSRQGGYSCEVTVNLVQSDQSLAGQFDTACGFFSLRGQIRGTALFGSLDGPDGLGQISGGLASSNQIQFQSSWTSNFFEEERPRDHELIKVILRR